LKILYDFFDQPEKIKRISIWLIIIGFLVIILYFILLVLNGFIIPKNRLEPSMVGQFGDFIGGVVGSLWTLATVLLLISTLDQQRKEGHNQSVDRIFRLVDSIDRQISILHLSVKKDELQGLDVINYISNVESAYNYIGSRDTYPYQDQDQEIYLENINRIYNNPSFRQLLTQLKSTNDYILSKIEPIRLSKEERREIQKIYFNSMPFTLLEHLGKSLIFYLNQGTSIENGYKSRLELNSEDWGKQTIETLENLDNSFLRIRDVFIREIGE
jgi:hypothetical protein